MSKYTNTTGIPLEMAVWLAHDEYNHNSDPKTISVTTLLKPIKQIILGLRITPGPEDIGNMIASRLGTAIHTSIEQSWVTNYEQSLKDLGYPPSVINKVCINPSAIEVAQAEDNHQTIIPVYLEKRTEKVIDGWTISGQFDMVMEGKVKDVKTTGTYTYIKKTNDEKYILQGSIYRWLNQDIITEDTMSILFVFTDWTALKASIEKEYPKSKILEYQLILKTIQQTETYIRTKLSQITSLIDEPESSIPACNSEDLWEGETKYAYYKNAAKTSGRSTKNFSSESEALVRLTSDGNTGVIVTRRGQVKACRYCPAIGICDQAKSLVREGRLVI